MSSPSGTGVKRTAAELGLWVATALAVLTAARVALISTDKAPRSPRSAFWILGPSAGALQASARAHLEAGLDALGEPSKPAEIRHRAYLSEMDTARALLERSLRANPIQPSAWARLAAIRWESALTSDPLDRDATLELIATASSMAANVPEVQSELGALLLRMGRIEEATPYLRHAIELDTSVAAYVVETLAGAGIEPPRIAETLPTVPEVLIALRRPYLDAGLGEEYLALLESALASPTSSLVRGYVDACVELRQSRRALARLRSLAPFADPGLELARLVQASRAARAAEDPVTALEFASEAARHSADGFEALHALGLAQLASGDAESAVRSLRKAVAGAARMGSGTHYRSRLYSDLGRAEERAGRPDRAYDDYRRALELDPESAFPRQRLEAMRRSAGAR